ncbi:MAG: SMC-Scp complex subunit ScpB [Elusimicrobiaceae bacterium]|nr:SMC-Scp complex subunit ScpB [Elusimicrobiaceae bacterium]
MSEETQITSTPEEPITTQPTDAATMPAEQPAQPVTEEPDEETTQTLLESEDLQKIIETLLFITDRPVKVSRLVDVIENTTAKEVREAIEKLRDSYTVRGSAVQILEIAGGYQMCTKPEYGRWVRRLYNEKMTTRLSNAALETLAIIAYKQPLTRAEMEGIRGVDVAGPLEKLLDRGLVRVVGRKDTIGHPMVYGTTDEFLRMFGLNKVSELPDLQVFAAKNLEEKQEDLPFGEPLPPIGGPRIIPLEELEGEERLEALDASAPDPFFQRNSYNQGDLTLGQNGLADTTAEGLPFEENAPKEAVESSATEPAQEETGENTAVQEEEK